MHRVTFYFLKIKARHLEQLNYPGKSESFSIVRTACIVDTKKLKDKETKKRLPIYRVRTSSLIFELGFFGRDFLGGV